jgi:hypothetical protein
VTAKKPTKPVEEYKPLMVDGKRDKARRYVAPDGSIISRREQIKRREGVTPEQKALRRFFEGTGPKGKTAEAIIRKMEDKKQTPKKSENLPVRAMNQGRDAYQLTGRYYFVNVKWRLHAAAIGYSTVSGHKKTGADFIILRAQAVANAQATLPHSGWEFRGIDYEHWLHW